MRRWRPLLLNFGAKSARQQDCCDLYYNKRWHQVDRPRSRPLLINVCQHAVDTDDGSLIQSTMVWLGRRHLAFAVANCVLNLRLSAATVGRCDDGWKLRRVAGEGVDGKCSFYFNSYFFRTTPTNRDLRQKAVYFPPRLQHRNKK